MKKTLSMKKTLFLLTAVFALLSIVLVKQFVIAEAAVTYTEGVTVSADANSPTGYTATFVYKNASAKNVSIYSDYFFFYTEKDGLNVKYAPYVWTKDMFTMNSSCYNEAMTNTGSGVWVITLPLPSGGFPYKYMVDGVLITDPANKPLAITSGVTTDYSASQEYSMVYMPFDSSKQEVDRSVEMPRSGQNGQVVYDTYLDGTTVRNLSIYLPYGYDENRTQPYKVIYTAHGSGGNELDWMSIGSLPNIMDNLIAGGKTEPVIVVTMNQTGVTDNSKNQMQNIMPFVEANYNASSNPEDLAYCGLSAGGSNAAKLYLSNPTDFAYFGIWSSAQAGGFSLTGLTNLDAPTVMIGIAKQDSVGKDRFTPATKFCYNLSALNIKYSFYTENGAHDWRYWTHMYSIFVRDIVWKSPAPTVTASYKVSEGGVISGNAIQEINKNSSTIYVTAVADTGYRFVQWSDGVKTAGRTDIYVNSDFAVTAQFESTAFVTPTTPVPTVAPTATPTTAPTAVPTAAPSYNDGITVNETVTLYVGGNSGKTTTINVTVPVGAVKSSITFKSSKTAVATVDVNGKVIAKAAGQTIITTTVKLTNGEIAKLNTVITVKKAKVTLTAKKASVTKGKSFTFKAKAYGSTKTITWKSSNKKIGRITSKGKFKAIKKGTVKITISCGSVKTTYNVKVK